MSQIRITKTKELDSILSSLRGELSALSDSEILKLALSKLYSDYVKNQKQESKKLLTQLAKKAGVFGDKFLTSKKLSKKDLSERDLYNLIKKA
jgi:ABC-type Zn uptake system ZnuABC Zn-binding protein ZnuA